MKKGHYWVGKKRPDLSERFNGKNNPMYGRTRSEEFKDKIRKKLSGSNSQRWKGGKKLAVERGRRKRRNLERNASGWHTFGEWETLKAQYNWSCAGCGRKEPEIKLTRDHIIPLIRGGSDNIENVQPLCRSCNSKKGTRIDYKFIS